MSGSSLSDLNELLKSYYSVDAIERLVHRGSTAWANVQHLTPAQASIAATVALGGLGWIVARRNQLAGMVDDKTFVAMVAEWWSDVWERMASLFAQEAE